MKQSLTLLAITFVFLLGTTVLNAQTNLNGKYSYKSDKGSDATSFYLTFERQDSVYYSYFHEGAGTIGGKWTLENGIIKVVLTRGNENWTIKFRQNGENLEIAEKLPEKGLSDIPDFKMVLPMGTVFSRIVDKPTGPDLTPQEIGKKVLKLVKSIRNFKDISPQNIERQTGIKVTFHNENRNEYGYGGNVIGTSDWVYGFSAYPYPSKDNKTIDTLRFSFDYQLHEPLNPDTAIISKSIDFDVFTKELQQAGFSKPMPSIRNHGFVGGYTMTRGKVSVYIGVKGGLLPNIDNYDKSKIEISLPNIDNCVKSIQVSILK